LLVATLDRARITLRLVRMPRLPIAGKSTGDSAGASYTTLFKILSWRGGSDQQQARQDKVVAIPVVKQQACILLRATPSLLCYNDYMETRSTSAVAARRETICKA